MGVLAAEEIRGRLDALYRSESRRILATLIRLLGDFDLAEDALHDAFAVALARWPREGLPTNPRSWLISTGRFKGIDALRRRARTDTSLSDLVELVDANAPDPGQWEGDGVEDDRLRLVFTCCHPALSLEAQIALTLREVCGLTTEEIAHAFLTQPSTLAQRIVRAKAKIRQARIPYEVPTHEDLPSRLDGVLHVVYLVFNEGYSASSGDFVTRHDLSAEAIRLGRLLVELLPDAEAVGLLALMLLHDSRRAARTSPEGELIRLEDQDRTLWDQSRIAEGRALVGRLFSYGRFGPYSLQAAIALEHAAAPDADSVRWGRIVELYDLLARVEPSPVVKLNRAVAIAMRDGPEEGLTLIDDLMAGGDLAEYHLAHAARAELCRRSGEVEEARRSYAAALRFVAQEPERRFLQRRLAELD